MNTELRLIQRLTSFCGLSDEVTVNVFHGKISHEYYISCHNKKFNVRKTNDIVLCKLMFLFYSTTE